MQLNLRLAMTKRVMAVVTAVVMMLKKAHNILITMKINLTPIDSKTLFLMISTMS